MTEQKSFEYFIEIPVKVYYTPHPAEKMTQTYPGCPAHIDVDAIVVGDVAIDEAVAEELCWDHLKGEGQFRGVPF